MTPKHTRLALCVARGPQQQQAAIDDWLRNNAEEGAPAGLAILAEGAFFHLAVPPGVPLARLAAGCVCCVGLLPLQVTLARLVRTHRPRALLLLVADASHLDRVRAKIAGGAMGVVLEECA